MKKVYFVRHGESTGNVGDFRQGPDTPLSKEGEAQAKIVAERFRSIEIDKIIVSTYLRAKQTAEYINEILNKETEYSDLLVERIKPSKVVGKRKDDPEATAIDKLHINNFHNPEFKFEDGETFTEMKKRALDLLTHIEKIPEERILCVSHGIFLRMVLACVVYGQKLTSHEYWDFYTNISLGNTGITIFEQSDKDGVLKWKLKVWGDMAHLGEVSSKMGDSW
jgi:broad specificity phosphatase PhoE